jgi:putative acetyltransferase
MILIRQRRPSDDGALLEVFNGSSFQRGAMTRGPFASKEELALWFQTLATCKLELVAEDSGEVIGFGVLALLDGERIEHGAWVILGVRETHHRRGLATELLETLLAAAKDVYRLRRVYLNVFADNEPAIKLYEKHGFQIEGTHRDFLWRDSGFVDACTMAKIFGANAPDKTDCSSSGQLKHAGGDAGLREV